jgi:hypothetical protein
MIYQVWDAYDPGSGFASVEEMAGLTDEQESAVFFGRTIPEPFSVVSISKLSAGETPDALGTFTASRLVSMRLREPIERSWPQGVQFIPARLPGRREPTYFLLNITSHVACFDRNRSQFKAYEDPPHAIRAVRKMALEPIPQDAPTVFHLAEMPAVILVRDDLRAEMRAVSSSPGTFTPIGQFRFGNW